MAKNVLAILLYSFVTINAIASSPSPQTTVYAFDLHHVIVKPDLLERARIFVQSTQRWAILQHVLNPIFLYDLYRTFALKATAYEPGMKQLCEKYPKLSALDDTIIELANAQRPDREVIQLVKQLKAQGYEVYLLSNISDRLFARFKEKFPDIVALFDGCAICERLNGYMRKPYAGMYKSFKNKFDLHDKGIIFIDDLLPNIQAAQAAGFHGIHFQTFDDLRDSIAP